MSVLTNYLDVSFNGTDLNSISGVTITGRRVSDLPDRVLRKYKVARDDGSVVTTSEFVDKKLVIAGVITATSRANTEIALDSLRGLLAKPEANIDITVAGAIRRWVGTMTGMSTTVKGGLTTFAIEFTCANPFGTATTATSLLNAVANTLNATSFALTNGGSFRSRPLLTLTYSAVSGGTAKTVTLSNDADGLTLTITRDWIAGDVLVVDNLNKTVQVNNVDVAYAGTFLSFGVGSTSLVYSDNFTTSRSMTATATYYKRYI